MRIFVAGASGVIGRRLVPLLVERGHDVTGMTRRQDRAVSIEAAGARAVVADVFDPVGLERVVAAAQPEVVVHQLTDIPPALDTRRYAELMAGNDRVRTEGTRNLMAAASAAHADHVVAQSIAFAYAPVGGAVKDEDQPLFLDAPHAFRGTARSVRELERAVTGAEGMTGTVLRYGYFYGSGSAYASDGSVAALVGRRRFPIVGRGEGVFSFVHVDDAAQAALVAVEGRLPGTFNIVDDEPSPVREWLPVYAVTLAAPKPLRVPRIVGRVGAGPVGDYIMNEQRGASNARATRDLGWRLRYATWREGFAEALG